MAGYPARILGYLLTSSYNVVSCEHTSFLCVLMKGDIVVGMKSLSNLGKRDLMKLNSGEKLGSSGNPQRDFCTLIKLSL